ncbi:N-acetyltransferase [Aquimarina sp. RZ0]|uniref:GNAT family N-acetyltransferase n=1 Tax=Aquimarina sp. RZ0 TaxID=2607730 RepID=UPI0011F1F53F|nr:GNAT family N-acetyltransferase [Aquimarina sp. RZ0]KAA1247332.1 GNAT family N-acetyltransferase [Aquimarina sp. RZ0]
MKKASFRDKQLIIDILYDAFITETFPNSINFVIKQDHNRSKRLYSLMEYQYKMALRFGEIFMSDDEQSCILFIDPEKKKITFKTLIWNTILVMRCIGFKNVLKVIKREKILRANHPEFSFLHLWIMGTKSTYKGKGIGAKLLVEVLKYYGNIPIYLETTTTSNLRFYQKTGFEIVNETHILGYPLYFLLKPVN